MTSHHPDPIPDKDSYPTGQQLHAIENWDILEERAEDLLAYIKALWWAPDWGWRKTKRRLYLSTGGWSGNEALIRALKRTPLFWDLFWLRGRRGEHHVFKQPRAMPRQKMGWWYRP